MGVSWFLFLFLIQVFRFGDSFTVIRGDPVAASSFITENLERYRSKDAKYNWTEEYFENMPIDHFSFADDRRFNLRYFINLEHFQENGPIFFYTGNEGSLESFAQNTGFMWDIAPLFKAAVVFAEHRFYGKTQPFSNSSYETVKNLGYLSSEQALADFVELITWLKSDRIPKAFASPVIAFGGSYGGMLAAWIRTKYPHIVQGSIAASAPVFWFRNRDIKANIFGHIVTRTFKSSGCSTKVVNAAFKAIDELSKTEDGRKKLNKEFSLDEKSLIQKQEDGAFLAGFISEAMKSMAMIDYPYPANFLTELPGWPVKQVCRKFRRYYADANPNNVDVLKKVVSIYYNYTGKATSFCANPEKCAGPYAQLGDTAGWTWQACTEMVMPMCDSNLPNDFFPNTCPFTLEKYIQDCQTAFEKIGYTPILSRPDWVIKNFGGEFPGASNIVFSNGRLDPWSGGGWRDKNTREGSLVSIILEQGAHHYDLRGDHPEDTQEVRRVQDKKNTQMSTIEFDSNPVTIIPSMSSINESNKISRGSSFLDSPSEQKNRPHTTETMPVPTVVFPSISDPSTLIFSPPNSVPIEKRLITQPDPSTYVAPVKAAGDVSLSGLQLVQFLIKASLRLKEGTTQQGVQVRLSKLHESVTQNLLSEASLKKLNYIVDEIDRELYDEAWTDFEQFVAKFPSEAAGWSQGIRIMLIELRRNAQRQFLHRSSSAGTRKFK
ncbi:hypothetical protein FO519_000282 [Halicephalobus sp. NKZ332]|nr:hypothetical protein FO519_000282 [Halicephalobus sp. NKZ332]